ncbi:MAG: ABC transporter substrate-binding protein [Hyphomicrobiales bacterium]
MGENSNYWTRVRSTPWNRRRFLGAAGATGIGAAGLVMVGCGDDDSDDDGADDVGNGSTTPGQSATSAATPRQGGRLTWADRNEAIWSSAPYGVASYGSALFYAFNDTLFRYPKSTLEPEPRLAESYEFNGDETELVVTLKPNIQYQDGSPIVAQHVIDNFNAINSPDTPNSQSKGPLNQYIASIEAPSDNQVRFKLKRPGRLVFDALNFLAIIDVKTLQDRLDGKPWNGSGPFRMTEFRPQEGATWEAHKTFWKPVRLEGVDFRYFADTSALAAAIETGEVQMTNRLNPDDVTRFAKDKGFTHVVGTGLTRAFSWGMSANGEVTKDPRIRRAIHRVIDRKRIAEDVMLGIYEPRYSLWGPDSLAFEDRYNNDVFNLDEARQLVAAAGYPDGTPPISLMTQNENFEGQRMFEIVQADARQAGLNLEIELVDGAQFSERFQGNDFPGMYQTTFGFFGMHPDTLPVMNFQVRIPNAAGYTSSRYEKWQADIAAARTQDERNELYREFNSIWDEDIWVFLITDVKDQWVVSKDIAGFAIDNFDVPNWEDVGLA